MTSNGEGTEVFVFDRPDLPNRCTWHLNADPATSPHTKKIPQPRKKIMSSILDNIGNTPLVRLNSIPKSYGLKCEILAKCEFFNAGGSIKDRIGLRMLEEVEKAGKVKPGDVLIEASSGNTGIGIALVAALKGYRCIIVLAEKISNEKIDTLKALGVEIVRTPTNVNFDSPESQHSVAQRLKREIPNSVILDQFRNPGNPLASYDITAEEILEQCDGQLDMIVVASGTGGTITGIGRKIKEKLPNCKIIAVDPEGSILSEINKDINEKRNFVFYELEGIGSEYVSTVWDRAIVDKWIKCNDKDSMIMARKIIREEGLMCGASSGAAMMGVVEAAQELKEGQRCVVIFPDGLRNYMTKFLSDQWMMERDFLDSSTDPTENHWWSKLKISSLNLQPPKSIAPSVSCQEAIDIMKKEGFDQLPVVDNEGIKGMVTLGYLMTRILTKKADLKTPVETVICSQFKQVTPDTTLGKVSRILDRDHYCLVVHKHSIESGEERTEVVGIVTQIDFLNYITNHVQI